MVGALQGITLAVALTGSGVEASPVSCNDDSEFEPSAGYIVVEDQVSELNASNVGQLLIGSGIGEFYHYSGIRCQSDGATPGYAGVSLEAVYNNTSSDEEYVKELSSAACELFKIDRSSDQTSIDAFKMAADKMLQEIDFTSRLSLGLASPFDPALQECASEHGVDLGSFSK